MVVVSTAPGGGRDTAPHLFKQALSASRSRLLELMQSINFGRIERLRIRDGEPVLDPRPLVIREHKFGSENGPRPELGKSDFALKKEVLELLAYLDDVQNGVIDLIEIKHGLAFRMTVTEVTA